MAEPRTTKAQLQQIVDRINKTLGKSLLPYIEIDNKFVPQAGNFHLDFAYGQVQLRQMSDLGGGSRGVLGGFHNMPQLRKLMYAYLEGIADYKLSIPSKS